MADIFISYSSYNREKATALVKELRAAGHDVWMDQGGIGGAMDWSSEIVEALNKAKTVLFLISKDSVTSHNCAKEIHLANEKHKNILPVVLEKTPLPVLFEYPLAGLQRVPYERTDAILSALEVLKSGKSVLEAMISQSKIDDGVIRLAVLPFEDQSPTQDNEWFANGMMDELIDTLGSLSNMKVNPHGDVIYYKKSRPKLYEIAADLKVRYIVEGAVQKLGDKIRIRVSLTDCTKHEQVWSRKYDGTFDDVFHFQDQTSYSIAESIKLELTHDDKQKIEKKPTDNAEAYELWLKGNEYHRRFTRTDFERALALFEEAARVDPAFAAAHISIANTSLEYYRAYSRDAHLLANSSEHIAKAELVLGESASTLWISSVLARNLGKYEEALHLAERAVELDPEDVIAYDTLGFAYQYLGRLEEAINAWERTAQLREHDRNAHFSYLIALNELGDTERLSKAASNAIRVFERYIRLSPDDLNARVQYANVLGWAGEHERSIAEARKLEEMEGMGGFALYNIACLYLEENDKESGLRVLRKSVEQGFRNIEDFCRDPDLAPLRGMPEFEALIEELEEKIAKEKNG